MGLTTPASRFAGYDGLPVGSTDVYAGITVRLTDLRDVVDTRGSRVSVTRGGRSLAPGVLLTGGPIVVMLAGKEVDI